MPRIPGSVLIVGAAALAAVAWIASRGGIRNAGQAAGEAIVSAADGVLTGVVVGAGEAVGIPATNMTECERAMAEGRTWDASFACPAGDFLKYIVK